MPGSHSPGYMRGYMEERRQKWRRAGLCYQCGDRPRPERKLCRSCADRASAVNARYRARRRGKAV